MKKYVILLCLLFITISTQVLADTVDEITLTEGVPVTANVTFTYSDGCARSEKYQTVTTEGKVQVSIFTTRLTPPGIICDQTGLVTDYSTSFTPPSANYEIIASLYLCPNGVDSGGELLASLTKTIGSVDEEPVPDVNEVPQDSTEVEGPFLDIKPEVINIKRNGEKIKAIIRLPKEYNMEDIDDGSIELGLIKETGEQSRTIAASRSKITKKKVVAEFDNHDVIELVKEIVITEDDFPVQATFFVKGAIQDGPNFSGTESVKLINP